MKTAGFTLLLATIVISSFSFGNNRPVLCSKEDSTLQLSASDTVPGKKTVAGKNRLPHHMIHLENRKKWILNAGNDTACCLARPLVRE